MNIAGYAIATWEMFLWGGLLWCGWATANHIAVRIYKRWWRRYGRRRGTHCGWCGRSWVPGPPQMSDEEAESPLPPTADRGQA